MSKRRTAERTLVMIGVRVTESMRSWLKRQAKKNKKTLSSYAAGVLCKHVEEAEVAA